MPIVTFKYSIREDHGLNFSCYSIQISHCFFSTMQKNKAKIKLCSNFVSANYVTETQNGYSSFFLFLLCSFLIGKKSHSTNLPQFHLPPPSFMHTFSFPSCIKTGTTPIIPLLYYTSQYHAQGTYLNQQMRLLIEHCT